jgi:hypothetical protein
MHKAKLLLFNSVGKHNILVTSTSNNLFNLRELIYNAHVWIHDNKVIKCHFVTRLFKQDDFLSDTQISDYFGIDLTQLTREKTIKDILQ